MSAASFAHAALLAGPLMLGLLFQQGECTPGDEGGAFSLRGNPFLDGGVWVQSDSVKLTMGEVQDELDGALGEDYRQRMAKELSKTTDRLRHMYKALSKNPQGRLGHDAARYALHRYFTHRYGMSVKGLEPAGKAWNSSSPTATLNNRVPWRLQKLFEERLHQQGYTLQDLAQFAVVLEHVVHNEAVEMLKIAFKLLDLPMRQSAKQDQIEEVVDTYMAILYTSNVTGRTLSEERYTLSLEDRVLDTIRFTKKHIHRIVPHWSEIQAYVRDIQSRMYDDIESNDVAAMDVASQMVDEISKDYGIFEDKMCLEMKNVLVGMSEQSNGRVKLVDFYKGTLQGHWQFGEDVAYLRNSGSLDETVAGNLRVIIPNYINSPTNCIGTSSIHTYCCLNECDSLLDQVERKIGAPEASPEHLLAIVASLPSATVTAPRTLTSSLVDRLEEIAATNGGMIPLHGRLFAQFLHHSYPNECPYPHKFGTTVRTSSKGTTAGERKQYIDDAQGEEDAKEEKKKQLMSKGGWYTPEDPQSESEVLPWSPDEELFIEHPVQLTRSQKAMKMFRGFVMVVALSVFALGLRRTVDPDSSGFLGGGKTLRHCN